MPRFAQSAARRPDRDAKDANDPVEQVEVVELVAVDDRAELPVRYVKLAIVAALILVVAGVAINLPPGRNQTAVSGLAASPFPSPARLFPPSPAAATPKPTRGQLRPVEVPAGVDPRSDDSTVGRHSLTVEGIPLSFSAPSSGWQSFGSLLISKSIVGPQGAEALIFWAGFPDGTYADPCGPLDSLERSTAADIAAEVSTAPGTELVAGPSDVTVGGRAAKHVVVIVREDVGCDPGFFYNWKAQTGGPLWVRTELGDTIRVWIIEVDGTLLFIAGETHADVRPGVALTEAGQARIEQEIQQIVDSIKFGNPDPPPSEEYIAQVRAICEAASDRFWAEVEGKGASEELEDIAAVSKAAVRIAEEALAELRALPAPEADRVRLDELFSLLEPPIDVLREVPAAAATGDTARVDALMGERVRRTHQKDQSVVARQPDAFGYTLQLCPLRLGA